jgi:2-polyprenyl-3-methyl-5-hydroxy-6-metoxy-1,4-benzoquinol methylase
MNKGLLNYLCDPTDHSPLKLVKPVYDKAGRIQSGTLKGKKHSYPIVDGVPRFVPQQTRKSVDGFGDQWNYFNYDDFRWQWLNHTVKHTFGKPDYFKGKVIVDAGAGHGMQSLWMAEAGAKHVIALELSHTVDDIMKQNLKGLESKVDIIQCSIDHLPLRKNSIPDIVMCHNVIQHTPSVEKTARALWDITKPGAEFVWNCYTRTDDSLIQRLRMRNHLGVRWVLQRSPFWVRLGYAHTMSALRFVPGLGYVLEKALLMGRGEITPGPHYFRRAYRAGLVITFDGFGSHGYQHYVSFNEQRAIAKALQPNEKKWRNAEVYFTRPMPIGAALRLTK